MVDTDSAADALNYHRTQAKWSNLVLLLFLIVLVLFTLYRVVVEWNLSAQFRDVEGYRAAMSKAESDEKQVARDTEELNFIHGRSAAGALYNSTSIGRPDLDLTPDPDDAVASPGRLIPIPRFPTGKILKFHRKYSPFFKECRVGNGLELDADNPTEFLSSSLARLAEATIKSDPRVALNLICGPGFSIHNLQFVPDNDANQVVEFARHKPLQPEVVGSCERLKLAAASVSEIGGFGWMPNPRRDASTYITESAGKCEPSPQYSRDANEILQVAAEFGRTLSDRLASGRETLVTFSEQEKLAQTIKWDHLIESLNKAANGLPGSEEQVATTRLTDQIKQLSKEAKDARELKALPEGSEGSRAQFTLVQFLFSALFVVAALTAAVTSSYMSRAHLFEVVEIERAVCGAGGAGAQRPNPFSKEPKPIVDIGSLKDLIASAKEAVESAKQAVSGAKEAVEAIKHV